MVDLPLKECCSYLEKSYEDLRRFRNSDVFKFDRSILLAIFKSVK